MKAIKELFIQCINASKPSNLKVIKRKMAKYYNKRVKLRQLDIRDLVLHKVTPATKDLTQGKLGTT